MRPTPKKIILGFCVFSLSLMAIACSSKTQDAKESITVNTPLAASVPTNEDKAIPKYDHIFVIIEENKSYDQIIGNPRAPIINQLGKTYGLATNFYAQVHPSEANYIAMLGGDTFGIHDDDAFYCQPGSSDQFCHNSRKSDYVNHTVASKSLMSQLEEKGLTWKGYFEDIPNPGSKAIVSPDAQRPLYASKHNGFISFKSVQDDPKLQNKIVAFDQLAKDLQSGTIAILYSIIVMKCTV